MALFECGFFHIGNDNNNRMHYQKLDQEDQISLDMYRPTLLYMSNQLQFYISYKLGLL